MYMDIKWVKLAVDWYKDDEIRLIRKLPDGDSIALMFVMMLAMAGELEKGGMIPYDAEDLSTLLDVDLNTVKLGLSVMLKRKLLESVNGLLHFTNWDKWQSFDKSEKLRQQRREATQRWREKKALAAASSPALPESTSDSAGFISDSDGFRIQEDHNAILDLAERIGIVTRDWDRDQIIDLYGQYGREVVEYALTESGKNNKKNLKYIEAICKNYGKPKSQEEDPIDAAARRFAEKEAAKRDK